MKINNFGYLIKEGIRGIFLHGFMSFAAICVTVACLLIVGSFSCLAYNFNIMVEDLNKTNEIIVYVDETYSDAEAGSVGTLINSGQIAFQTGELYRSYVALFPCVFLVLLMLSFNLFGNGLRDAFNPSLRGSEE